MQKEELFMTLFRFTPDLGNPTSEADEAAMRADWGNFIGNIAISEKLVSTYQLGLEAKKVYTDLSVEERTTQSEQQVIGGNMVVRARSFKEVVELVKNCPILKMGGTVEIRPIVPMY